MGLAAKSFRPEEQMVFSSVQYIAALFELFAGFNMIFSPEALLGGYKPATGFETLAFEWFGLACICFGISLFLAGSSMKLPNLIYQLVWLVTLGTTYMGKPWRPESAVADGSWAFVPLSAHAFFFVSAILAMGSKQDQSIHSKQQ